MISFIVSTCNRPYQLAGCLSSLYAQDGNNEAIVCDNSDAEFWEPNREITRMFEGYYVRTSELGYGNTCYHSPEYTNPDGAWLCFPSDDSYYVPGFSRIMLAAAKKNGWEFVYCDMLYDPRLARCTTGEEDLYSVKKVCPSLGGIDKTCFLITRRAFDAVGGWPQQESDWRDGALAQAVVQAGIKHGKAPGVMVVHN